MRGSSGTPSEVMPEFKTSFLNSGQSEASAALKTDKNDMIKIIKIYILVMKDLPYCESKDPG